MKRKRKLKNLPLDLVWLIIIVIIEVIDFTGGIVDTLSNNLKSLKLRIKKKTANFVIDFVSLVLLKTLKMIFDFFKDFLYFLIGDIKDFEERKRRQTLLYKIVFWLKYLTLLLIILLLFIVKGFTARTLVIIISSISLFFLFPFSDFLKNDDL